jgi:hypothetical protein
MTNAEQPALAFAAKQASVCARKPWKATQPFINLYTVDLRNQARTSVSAGTFVVPEVSGKGFSEA